MKLSRRDRAAMTLALECCRGRWMAVWSARTALYHGTDPGPLFDAEPGPAVRLASTIDRIDRQFRTPDEARLLRARLALALRVLLRADREDYGPRVGRVVQPGTCITCGGAGPLTYTTVRGEACSSVCASLARRILPRRSIAIRPLWESAPPHEVSR